MRKVRWGVLGAAKIAVNKVIPALQRSDRGAVVAIASRSLEKARSAARDLAVPNAYGSYEELLADPDVEAIYNPLPNHLHVPWSIKSLEAGKHVLCEKPIGLSVAEAHALVDAGRKHPSRKLMEAFMYRHHPQWVATVQMIAEGRIGDLTCIQSFFSYFNRTADDIRNVPEMGGGGLMDIGCYPISLSRLLFGKQPERVLARVDVDPEFGTDRLASGILDFGSGSSTFTCGTQLSPYQRVHVHGTTGRIEIEIPFNAPPDRSCRLWHQTESGIEEIRFATCDQYTLQGDAFCKAILDDAPVPTPISDAIGNMAVIEAMVRAGKSGAWETV